MPLQQASFEIDSTMEFNMDIYESNNLEYLDL
jgi:hypothetical protein